MGLSPSEFLPQEAGERRRSERLPLRKDVRIYWPDRGVESSEDTFTLTVSLFGCAIASRGHLQPDSQIVLRCDGKFMPGRVLYNLHDSSKDFIEVGISFDEEAGEFWDSQF